MESLEKICEILSFKKDSETRLFSRKDFPLDLGVKDGKLQGWINLEYDILSEQNIDVSLENIINLMNAFNPGWLTKRYEQILIPDKLNKQPLLPNQMNKL